jgi:hypothetical protein
MSAIMDAPPAPGTYRYVVRRFDRDAANADAQPIAFASYEEATDSRAIELGGEVAHTLFLQGEAAHHRALCTGWLDCTEQWQQALEDAKPRISTPSQRAIFAALTDEWQDKRQLLQASDVSDGEWRTTIRLLEERGLAECNLTPRQRRHAAQHGNMGYRYKRGPRAHEV